MKSKPKFIKNRFQEKYVVTWEEKYSTFVVDLFARATKDFPEIIGNNIAEYLSFIEKINHVINFYSERAYKKVKREHGSYFLKKNRIKNLISKYDILIKENRNILNKINSINLSNIDDKDLEKFWEKFSKHLIEMAAYFRATRPEVEIGPVCLIKDILIKNYPLTEINKKLITLATPTRLGLIERERRDWLRILKSKKNKGGIKKSFLKHVNNYPSFYINIYDTNKILNVMEKRFLQDRKYLNKLEKDIKENDIFLKKLPYQQNKIIKECKNNKKLIIFSKMLKEFAWYRFEIKNLWAGVEIVFMPFFKEISKRLKISLFDFLNFYTLQDISNSIKNKEVLSIEEIKKRKKCMAIIVKNKKYDIMAGDKAQRLLIKIKKNLIIEKEIKGTVAYPGKVKGRVKIIFPESMEKTRKKFNKGDILVTTNTQPSMVPLMTKAGAIVNDVGGITSHAAIVSREFKIPCIIGTKTATKVLKDGDLVEVNAFDGVVKVL